MSSRKDIAVSVRGLSKSYTIAHEQEKQSTLAETLLQRVRQPFQRPTKETFSALQDVSFDINKGDVVGIIGRNGAGKSTLLKILSRITEPTKGEIKLYGRVGSLLEVGTGFHPELTGRENIYLNGQILGMRKKEIDRQFDAIVEFSGCEKFLDTPVKRYSSGMYVRLAFAVAAHLESEILIVDEVLAVGDADFQRKCLGKMQEVGTSGRTVLFVSHNLGMVQKICTFALLLEHGRVRSTGSPANLVGEYMQQGGNIEGERHWPPGDTRPGNDREASLCAVRIVDSSKNTTSVVAVTDPFSIEVEYEVAVTLKGMRVVIVISTSDGIEVLTSIDQTDKVWAKRSRTPGRYSSVCTVPGNLLNIQKYFIRFAANIPGIASFFDESNALSFSVESTGGMMQDSISFERWAGVICPDLPWQVRQINTFCQDTPSLSR